MTDPDPLPGLPDPRDQTAVSITGKEIILDERKNLKLGKMFHIEIDAVVTEVGDRDTNDGKVHFAKLAIDGIEAFHLAMKEKN